jgi:hypothetical protein
MAVLQNLPSPQFVYNGFVPCNGPKSCPVPLDFSVTTSWQLDLTNLNLQGYMEAVQTMFIDNSLNAQSLSILCSVTNQNIIIPPQSQGYVPTLQPNPSVLTLTTTGAVLVTVQLLNFYIPPAVWSINLGAIPSALVVNNTLKTTDTPLGTTFVDKSGTIAVGGTVQLLMASNASRKRFIVHNPSTAAEILQICFGLSTAGRIDLIAGATWDDSGSTVAQDAVFVVAATGAHAFKAYEAS